MQILPQDYDFGTSIGTGLGQGLHLLAQNKLQDLIQTRQREGSLKGLQALGFSPEQAQEVAYLDPSIQREVVKQQLQAPQQQAYAQALSSLLGGQETGQPPQMGTEEQMEQTFGLPGMTPTEEKIQNPQKASSLTFLSGGLTPQQATELAKLGIKKQESNKKDIAQRYKATAPYRKEVLDATKSARRDLQDLNRMEDLEKEGKLDTPGYVEFLQRSGLDIPALMNPGSEEFQKIANNFLRNAKQYFGARVTNFEIDQFLKTIPSLSQSPEGRKRVIANLKNLSRSALEYNNALKDVVAQNGGLPPFDLQEKVEDKVEKRMDALYKQFKKDLERPVPKGQNRFITALQAGLGDIVGVPGKILGKAGKAISAIGEL